MGDVAPEVESPWAPPRPGAPAAHLRIYLALLPSGPDAVRRLRLHRARAAVRPTTPPDLEDPAKRQSNVPRNDRATGQRGASRRTASRRRLHSPRVCTPGRQV